MDIGFSPELLLAGDLLGVFFFAVSGSLLAVRLRYDIIGSLLLGGLTGLGGGIVRDLIINAGPPNAFQNPVYLLPAALAALLVYFTYSHVSRFRRSLALFDAAGLSLFCVMGTLKALEHGLPPVPSMLLGVSTAAGGGLLRDVVANVPPSLFSHEEVYAVPAFLGAGTTAALWSVDFLNLWTGLAAAGVAFTYRMLSFTLGWKVPLASRSAHRS